MPMILLASINRAVEQSRKSKAAFLELLDLQYRYAESYRAREREWWFFFAGSRASVAC